LSITGKNKLIKITLCVLCDSVAKRVEPQRSCRWADPPVGGHKAQRIEKQSNPEK
jgi:hypothetical protein